MRPIYAMTAALVFVCISAFAMTPFNGDDVGERMRRAREPIVTKGDVDKLYQACLKYAHVIDAHEKRFKAFEAKLLKRVETRMSDNGVAKQDAYQSLVLEWMRDNEDKLKERDSETVDTACFWVKALLRAKTGLPFSVLKNMTRVRCFRLIKYLGAKTEAEIILAFMFFAE